MKKIAILAALVIFILAVFVFGKKEVNNFISTASPTPTQTLVGGDKDEHGCIPSAGYSWCEAKQKCLRQWEEQCGADNEEILKVVDNFYKAYESCMKNPPEEAKDKVSIYCQANTGFTAADFERNLDAGGTAKAGADPVVCAQDFPENIKTSTEVRVNKNEATTFVDEKFGPSGIRPQINLIKENNIWKVSNIICPRPE